MKKKSRWQGRSFDGWSWPQGKIRMTRPVCLNQHWRESGRSSLIQCMLVSRRLLGVVIFVFSTGCQARPFAFDKVLPFSDEHSVRIVTTIHAPSQMREV